MAEFYISTDGLTYTPIKRIESVELESIGEDVEYYKSILNSREISFTGTFEVKPSRTLKFILGPATNNDRRYMGMKPVRHTHIWKCRKKGWF